MAAVDVTISGVLYDKVNRTTQPVVLIGEATLTGVGVGGGPVIPPPVGGGEQPPNYPNIPPHPAFPIAGGPGAGFPDKPGYPPVVGGGPIVPPPDWQPPSGFTPPPPGATAPVGPPVQPVHPIVIPDFILIQYPGYGWIAVGKPVPTEPTPAP